MMEQLLHKAFIAFALSCLCMSCKEYGNPFHNTISATSMLFTGSLRDSSDTMMGDIFIDTVIKNNALKVTFVADTIVIQFNQTITKSKVGMYCSHLEKNIVLIMDHGESRKSNFVMCGDVGAIFYRTYDDIFERCQCIPFKITGNQLVFLDYENIQNIVVEKPAVEDAEKMYVVDDSILLLYKYCDRLEDLKIKDDSIKHRKRRNPVYATSYAFSRINFSNSTFSSFEIIGTGNESMYDDGIQAMIRKASGYSKK